MKKAVKVEAPLLCRLAEPILGDMWHEPERDSRLARVIHSTQFESFTGAVIGLNSLFIGYTSQHNIEQWEDPNNDFIATTELLFTAFYTMELLSKMLVHRLFFFFNKDNAWNIFDTILVAQGLYDLVMSMLVGEDDTPNLLFLRLLRLFKLVKIFRMLRVMRFFTELRVILFSVIQSMRSLMWAGFMLIIIEYIFALVFMHAVANYLPTEDRDEQVVDRLMDTWGTVYKSMVSLYKATTGGTDWETIGDPIQYTGEVYYVIFLMHVGFLLFAVLNILTGVFLNDAAKASERDMMNVTLEAREQEEEDLRALKLLFRHIDQDGNGKITLDEFVDSLEQEEVQGYFSMLHIDATDAVGFFKLLTQITEDNSVEYEAFVESCAKLQGEARRADVQILSWEIKQIHNTTLKFMKFAEKQFHDLRTPRT